MTKFSGTMGPIKMHLMNILTMHSDKAFVLHTNCVLSWSFRCWNTLTHFLSLFFFYSPFLCSSLIQT